MCKQERSPHHSSPITFLTGISNHATVAAYLTPFTFAARGAKPNTLAPIPTIPKAAAQHLLHIIRSANLIFTTVAASLRRT